MATVTDVARHHGDLQQLRIDFRAWLTANLPAAWCQRAFPQAFPPGSEDPDGVAVSRQWHRRLYEGGWAAPGWPVELGGRGLGLAERLAIAEELALARAPVPLGFQGIDLLGPTLIAHASDAQRQQHLPSILSGEQIWCQGYSEPEAGSDLASLRTAARRDGDDYIVNGRKVWTSFGERANWCFLLARTGEPGSGPRGVSFFLTPMDAAGLEWRPILEVSGVKDFGELLLDDVRIPSSQRVGAEGDGWRVAMASLGHERLIASNAALLRVRISALLQLARVRGADAAQRQRVTSLRSRLVTIEGLQSEALRLAQRQDPRATVWASLVKLGGSELRTDIANAALDLLGADAQTYRYHLPPEPGDVAGAWVQEGLACRASTIYAGTSEIQRNIIAERGLGLPKEPK